MAILTTTATIALISAFKEKIIQVGTDAKSEVVHFLDNGLPEYINSIRSKFQFTKTFLYRNETVNFYDVFFPVSVTINNKSKKITDCHDLFSASNYVSIIGSAGSGKTMLMKHFFLQSIQSIYKIPLFIELRSLNDFNGGVKELIYEVIFENRLSPNKKILERMLETGSFILLLDGYDEIYSVKKDQVTNDLDKFIDRYAENNYIISSRPGSGLESMPRFNNYPVCPLNKDEIQEFINLVLKGNDDKELSKKIQSVILKKENADYANFLSSPLLLSMFILTFNQYPELPKKKSKFYWNVFDTLATKHDSFTKKGGYLHERKSGLQNDQFEKILQWFSYIALFNGKGKVSFDAQYLSNTLTSIKQRLNLDFDINLVIEDLSVAISILIIDGIEYKFPHKSLQEYFAVMLIKELPYESKKKIYNEKYLQQVTAAMGGSDNFWNLSDEIDFLDFNREFILHNLRVLNSKISDLTHLATLEKLYKLSDYQSVMHYNVKGDKFVPTESSRYLSSWGGIVKLLEFTGIGDFDWDHIIWKVYENAPNIFKAELDKQYYKNLSAENIDKKNEVYLGFVFWSQDLKDALENIDAKSILNTFLLRIETEITILEHELSNVENADLGLLGI